ncbi:uncharacterized protein [Antedon mediterranea]|uniref:uncharacterized protein isoform X2 n=1 Tax=Antedon mediterranea TaxID=105859 RepID=UPI003AF8C472
MSLSELFVQILESEQKAEERKHVLNEIKNEIGNTRGKLGKVQEQKLSLQGQQLIKTKKLSEEELNLKLYTIRENVLKEQLCELQVINKERLKDLSIVREQQEYEKKIFHEELEKFSKEYDMQGNGVMERQGQAQVEVDGLKEQESLLNKEMSEYREHTKTLNKLTDEKESMIKEINELEMKWKDLDEEVQKEEEKIKKLEKEKKELASKSHTCSEFKRLQNELETCQDDNLESVCAALQLELDQLQRNLWQKQLQNRTTRQQTNTLTGQQTRGQPSGKSGNNRSAPKQSCFKWAPPTKVAAPSVDPPKPNLKKLRQNMKVKNKMQDLTTKQNTQNALFSFGFKSPTFDLQLDSLFEDF